MKEHGCKDLKPNSITVNYFVIQGFFKSVDSLKAVLGFKNTEF